MIQKRGKRAVSPIIATVILVMLVMVLASIVFMWAKGFFSEDVAKFDQAIENSCERVNLKAIISEGGGGTNILIIQNNGQIPVYNIAYKIVSSGSIDWQEHDRSALIDNENLLEIGSAKSLGILGGPLVPTNPEAVVPILRGKTSSGKLKEYICEEIEIYIE